MLTRLDCVLLLVHALVLGGCLVLLMLTASGPLILLAVGSALCAFAKLAKAWRPATAAMPRQAKEQPAAIRSRQSPGECAE